MTEETIIEKEKYLAEIVEQDGKLHVWFRNKQPYAGLTEDMIAEIKENLRDFGKWKEFKELKRDLG